MSSPPSKKRRPNGDATQVLGTTIPPDGSPSSIAGQSRNAFQALMAPKPKPPPPSSPSKRSRPAASTSTFGGRDGLGAYIAAPETFSSPLVIYHNDAFVAINDLYPKASVHTLLLPRDPEKMHLHPFDALADPVFLESVRTEAEKLKDLVASELRRSYGKYSTQETARREALDADPPPEQLPAGRDWRKEVMIGIHSGPSMNHLHIHVLSVDRVNECMRHRKHYNSFATPFFVVLDEFPLKEDDDRWRYGKMKYLDWEFKCWRCGKMFGNRFSKLKAHLQEEFEVWKRI
ncbi:aprataxin-like protein [Agyrium rufum]|nr:aprataxin-like protein [Agyrium rufum]